MSAPGSEPYPSARALPWRSYGRLCFLSVCGLVVLAPRCLCQQAQPPPSPPSASKPVAPPDVAAPPEGAIVTDSGVAMTVLEPGSGEQRPNGDDCVVVRFTGWRRDGTLFSTSGLHGESTVQCLTAAIPGVAEALRAMRIGEKRRIWVPAALAFAAHVGHGQKTVGDDDDNKAPKIDLTFDVELLAIRKAPELPADLKSPPRTAFRTPAGVAMNVLTPGAGAAHPTIDSRITVNYTEWTSAGALFESTIMSGHPAVWLVGTTLPGLRDALQHMTVGEKARVWIPAALANGNHPMDHLAAGGNLVYDIELLEIK